MQFSCESCKAQLQIADEKVRGKRLLVRCKRCGAKITIADPALAAARPKTGPVRIAPPSRPAAPAASAPPAAAAPKPAPAPVKESDTESTRAMDSNVLEQALQASKAEGAPARRPQAPAPEPVAASQPAPAPQPVPAAQPMAELFEPAADEGPVWFAMVHGKQDGPVTREELAARVNEGAIGPRTYLWKDGMGAWQRAREIAELEDLFPSLPDAAPAAQKPAPAPKVAPKQAPAPAQKPAPAPKPAPQQVAPQPAPAAPSRPVREFTIDDLDPAEPAPAPEQPRLMKPPVETPVGGIDKLGADAIEPGLALATPASGAVPKAAADLAGWATAELQKKSVPPEPRPAARRPKQPPSFNFDAPSEGRSGLPLVMAGVVLVLALIGAAIWYFASGTPANPPEKQQAQAEAPASKPEASREAGKTSPAQAAATPATGLSADQVKKKLDENKPALQGCIDEALRRDPNLRVGKIHIATRIAPSGSVTAAKIDKQNVEQSPLGACLRKATQRISFPSFAGDAFDVDIPIVVTAGD